MSPIISVKEARRILGSGAQRMADEEIVDLISVLESMSRFALKKATRELQSKKDAQALAGLIYDIYKDRA